MLIIAHRGASGHAPENTLASFRLAIEMGARAIELDIHQTKDGELLVIHDEDFKRVGRTRKKVSELTRAQAQAIDVGSWFGKGFSQERAPTLGEVYDLVAGRAEIHVEIKHGSKVYPGIEARLARFIERRNAWKSTLVSSFDHHALFAMREVAPKARLGYLLGLTPKTIAWREMKEMDAESLNVSRRQANARLVKAAHERRLRVLVYTVVEQRQLNGLARLDADGVFCNFPELRIK